MSHAITNLLKMTVAVLLLLTFLSGSPSPASHPQFLLPIWGVLAFCCNLPLPGVLLGCCRHVHIGQDVPSCLQGV